MAGVQWLVYHLCSLETLLVLFLHARHLKLVLPGTPVPETLFYGALSVAVGSWIILREGIYLRGIPIVVAGLAFSGWMVAAYGWTAETVLARENLPFILGINLWAVFVAACVVAGSRERVLRFLLILVLLSTILAVSGSYIYLVHGSFRFYRGSGGEWEPRTYLYWGNIIVTGSVIAMAIAIHTRFGSLRQLLSVAILGIGFFFVMISGARGAALGIFTAALFALFVDRPRIRDGRIEMPKTQLVVIAIAALFVVYIVYLLTTGQTTSTLGRFLKLFDQANDPLLRSGANRFDYFAGAYRIWLSSPVFGQGLAGFTIAFCGYDQPGCHPHNAFLHVLADFGLIGFIFFVVFLWTGLRHCTLDRLRQDPLQMTLLMTFITIAMYAMVAVDLPMDHRVFFFVGLLALRPPPPDTPDDIEDDDD